MIVDKLKEFVKKEKFMSLWVKHPRSGKPDTMLTLSVYAFVIAALKFLVNGVSFSVMGNNVDLGTVSAALIGAVLTPTLGAYTARKWKDSPDKNNNSKTKRGKKQ